MKELLFVNVCLHTYHAFLLSAGCFREAFHGSYSCHMEVLFLKLTFLNNYNQGKIPYLNYLH